MPWWLSDHIFIALQLTSQNFQSILAHVARFRKDLNVFRRTLSRRRLSRTLSRLSFSAQIFVQSHTTAKRAFVLWTPYSDSFRIPFAALNILFGGWWWSDLCFQFHVFSQRHRTSVAFLVQSLCSLFGSRWKLTMSKPYTYLYTYLSAPTKRSINESQNCNCMNL